MERDARNYDKIERGGVVSPNEVYYMWFKTEPSESHPLGGLYHLDRFANRNFTRNGRVCDRYTDPVERGGKGWQQIHPREAIKISEMLFSAADNANTNTEAKTDGTARGRKVQQ